MEAKQPFYLQKRNWIVAVLLIIFVVVVSYVSGTGILTVSLSGSTTKELATNLTNQDSGKSSEIKTSSSFSKYLPKSSYEIFSKDTSGSFFAVAKTKGFLQKTAVDGKLVQEKSRAFIGNNPRTCSYYVGGTLYSYYCNDSFTNVVMHVPATASLATYISKNTKIGVDGSVEGTANLGGKTYLLLRSPATEGTSKPTHTAYSAGSNFSLINPIPLKDLDNSAVYEIATFQDGFLVYNAPKNDYWYYGQGFSNPRHLQVPGLKDPSLKRPLVGFNKTTLVITRSNKSDFENHDNPNNKIGKVKTQVDIYENGAFKTVVFDQKLDNFFTGLEPCGQDLICMISNKKLYVYDISGDNAKLSYGVNGVDYIYTAANQTLLIRDKDILNFNAATANGYVEYSFGSYGYCGLQRDTDNGYILCVSGISGVPSALYIDRTKDNTDNIDKKVGKLGESKEVKSVSAYGKFIYIVPNLGDLVYNRSIKGYDYDPAVKKSVASKINQTVDELGMDRSSYTVINTLHP